ncbi:hypothetical protein [Azospirillum sp. sgz302134]
MSILANADANKLVRLRAEEVLERKGTGASRQAGELAGQFAAMLEQLNGVGASGGGTSAGEVGAASPVSALSSVEHRLGVGAVSVFAQSAPDDAGAGDAQTPDPQPPSPDDAMQVVQSALQAQSMPNNFRWLTTLLTQTGQPSSEAPQAPKPGWT